MPQTGSCNQVNSGNVIGLGRLSGNDIDIGLFASF